MDRYWFYYGTTTKERDQYKSPNGDFVLYSDVESLQARVRELEEVIRTMAKGDDYISPEELDDILKGTP